jgi:hypothetical protein
MLRRHLFKLLLEAVVVDVVRIFLVNTYAVPHLLLINAVAKEAETCTLASV